jgi:hypothetical protein
MAIEGVLQSCRGDSREECSHSRQIEEVGGTVLLCKPDGWDTCMKVLRFTGLKGTMERIKTNRSR